MTFLTRGYKIGQVFQLNKYPERRGNQEKLTKAILSKSKPSDSNLRKNRKLEDASATDDAAAAATDDTSVAEDTGRSAYTMTYKTVVWQNV